jgi:hypothetical protein
MKSKFLWTGLLFVFMQTSLFAQFSRLTTLDAQFIDDQMNNMLITTAVQGASVGIVIDGEIAYLKGYGIAYSPPADRSTTECTLFRTASVCKPITRIVAEMLEEQGTLNMGDFIVDLLPNFQLAIDNPTLTIGQCLGHTGGVRGYGEENDALKLTYGNTYPTYDYRGSLDVIANVTVNPANVGSYNYSTWNYVIAGAAMAVSAGKPYMEIMREQLIDPLNLPYFQPEYQWLIPYEGMTDLYNSSGDIVGYNPITYKVPGGGFITTAVDYAMIIKAYVTGQLISSPYHVTHNGAQTGASSSLKMNKTTKNGIIILSNTTGQTSITDAVRNTIHSTFAGYTQANLIGNAYDESQPAYPIQLISGIVNNGQTEVQQAFDIKTIGGYTVSPGGDSRNIAQKRIVLSPGFSASTGSFFLAAIENVDGECPAQGRMRSALIEESKTVQNKLYPNPATDQIFIEPTNDVSEIRILNGVGQQVRSVMTNKKEQLTIDVQGLSSGLYMVQFISPKKTAIEKLIIE